MTGLQPFLVHFSNICVIKPCVFGGIIFAHLRVWLENSFRIRPKNGPSRRTDPMWLSYLRRDDENIPKNCSKHLDKFAFNSVKQNLKFLPGNLWTNCWKPFKLRPRWLQWVKESLSHLLDFPKMTHNLSTFLHLPEISHSVAVPYARLPYQN